MNIIQDTLRILKVSPRYRGYQYLSVAVELVMGSKPKELQLTKAVYPLVAKQYQTTWPCVERNIRTAIAKAWEGGGGEPFCTLTGYRAQIRPTNGQFIVLLAEKLRALTSSSRDNVL